MAPGALRWTGNHTVDLWIDAWRFGAIRGASESAVGHHGDSVLLLLSGEASVCGPTALWPCCCRANKARSGGREGGGDLRDGVLCKREVLHQHIQPLVVLIQELPYPPVGKWKRKIHLAELVLKKNLHGLCSKDEQVAFFIFPSWNQQLLVSCQRCMLGRFVLGVQEGN